MPSNELRSSLSPYYKTGNQEEGLPKVSQRHVSNLVTISAAPQVDHHRSLPPNQLTLTDPAYSPSRFAAPPFDPSSFLTTLAAQERRVLELREELQKAESDLSYLKIRWARYGAGRKRGELRPVGQLQSLSGIQASVIMCQIESGGPSTLLGASLRNGTERSVIRKSTQRVFSGSRHTRALSLLSPDATSKQSIEPRRVNEALSPTVTTTQIHSRQPPVSGWSPLSRAKQTVEFGLRYRELAGSTSIHPLANEVLVKGGKRMASDLREGLWTFFEDIRQATVGEEGISGTATRTPGFGSQQQRDSRRVQESDQTRNRAKIKEEVKRVCDEEEMPKVFENETPLNQAPDNNRVDGELERGENWSDVQHDDTFELGHMRVAVIWQRSSKHDAAMVKEPDPVAYGGVTRIEEAGSVQIIQIGIGSSEGIWDVLLCPPISSRHFTFHIDETLESLT